MGTNYYFRYNLCKCCDRYDELHIGKSSGGWQFLFHCIDEDIDLHNIDPKSILLDISETHVVIDSYEVWKKFINKFVLEYGIAKIFDEYDREVTPAELYDKIDSKRKLLSHYHNVKEDRQCFLDPDGHSFIRGEFS